jgi:hypothetical protein
MLRSEDTAQLAQFSVELLSGLLGRKIWDWANEAAIFFFKGGFFILCQYFIQCCFICHHSDSTVSEDAGKSGSNQGQLRLRHLISDALSIRLNLRWNLAAFFWKVGNLRRRMKVLKILKNMSFEAWSTQFKGVKSFGFLIVQNFCSPVATVISNWFCNLKVSDNLKPCTINQSKC